MAKNEDLMERALKELEHDGMPTEQQKDIMLNRILMQGNTENASGFKRLTKLAAQYPWRFAFTVSAVQAVAFTLIFGTQYTNLFLGFFGS